MKSILWILAILLAMPFSTSAHDVGLSSLVLRLNEEDLAVQITVARNDLEARILVDEDLDGIVSREEMELVTPRLKRLVSEAIQIQWDGRAADPDRFSVRSPDSSTVELTARYSRARSSRLTLLSRFPDLMSYGHRQNVAVTREDGGTLYEGVIAASGQPIEIHLNEATMRGGLLFRLRQFTGLGVEHILQGYDHLLFLVALLLAGGGLRSAVKIISSFTVAHSITLALASLNYIHLPSRLVELLIALSIVYVGIENLLSRDFQHRWRITFLFGLVHGLGFASVFQDLGLANQAYGVVVPLLSFNVGVEIGQVAIALLALPLLRWLAGRPRFVLHYAPACSVLISVMGGYWFLQRTFL
ncbi:MAG: HupE/UreJ family protein [Acidobacteriota bacterium]